MLKLKSVFLSLDAQRHFPGSALVPGTRGQQETVLEYDPELPHVIMYRSGVKQGFIPIAHVTFAEISPDQSGAEPAPMVVDEAKLQAAVTKTERRKHG